MRGAWDEFAMTALFRRNLGQYAGRGCKVLHCNRLRKLSKANKVTNATTSHARQDFMQVDEAQGFNALPAPLLTPTVREVATFGDMRNSM